MAAELSSGCHEFGGEALSRAIVGRWLAGRGSQRRAGFVPGDGQTRSLGRFAERTLVRRCCWGTCLAQAGSWVGNSASAVLRARGGGLAGLERHCRRDAAESAVNTSNADLVPTEVNLREAYGSIAELEAACEVFCGGVTAATFGCGASAELSGEGGRRHGFERETGRDGATGRRQPAVERGVVCGRG